MDLNSAQLSSNSRPGNGFPLWKRVLDLSLLMLLAPGWLLVGLLVALVIKLGSPGPVFFRQQRVGYKGRQFLCFKFRTMKVNAETDSHRRHVQALIKSGVRMEKLDARKDPRLVPLGSLLRASGLDELPQLLNVLRGDMSLVGPRPCIPMNVKPMSPGIVAVLTPFPA
jgi:lipopolysaccharide/colanic/teichoic acid biosynthesis glycosyltransferase